MQYLSNRLIVRYLLLLAAIFSALVCVIVTTHLYLHALEKRNTIDEQHLKAHIDQSSAISTHAYRLEALLYGLPALSANASGRQKILEEIHTTIHAILSLQANLSGSVYLENSPHLEHILQELPLFLFHIETLATHLKEAVDFRDTLLAQSQHNLANAAQKIRTLTNQAPPLFQSMHTSLGHLTQDLEKTIKHLVAKNQLAKKHYAYTHIAVISTCVILFIVFMVLVFKQLIGLYQRLETQLKIDPLTKLPNRFAFAEDARLCKTPMVAIVNIDAFRTINELYGVEAGNEILLQLAATCKHFATKHGLRAYRTSGDEFVFYHCHNGLDKDGYVNRILLFLEETKQRSFTIACAQEEVRLSLSCGIGIHPDNPLGKADMALHRAKNARQSYAIYDASLDDTHRLQENRYWIAKIQHAIEHEAFVPLFQPIVTKEGFPLKFEALVRLKQISDEGLVDYVAPAHFLELSHKIKCYHALSKSVLFQSFAIAKTQGVCISVNLCYQDIINPSLQEALKEALVRLDVGRQITFEITETEDIKNYESIKVFMDAFRPLGVTLALDDFGSGFSNFNYISILKPDCIKIDGSLIRSIHNDAHAATLVKAICALSQELGIQTIAEHVHCYEVFEKAQSLGVDLFQGYYFSPPSSKIPPKDIPLPSA